jgi:Domain of unknown function (DUF222)
MFSSRIECLVGMSDGGLDQRLRELELERRAHDAELIAAILVAEQRGLYGRDGHRTMNAYLRATFNWSNAEAGRWRAQARAVGAIAGVGDAVLTGRIGTPQVSEFAKAHSNRRVRDALDELAPSLIRHAEELSFRDFQIVMQHVVRLADADGAERDDAEAIDGRTATMAEVDGSLYLQATGGDAMSTAEMLAILDRFVEREFRADVERSPEGGELPRTGRQRRFDAIRTIFLTANEALDAGLPAGRSPEPLVNIVIDDATWARMLADERISADTAIDGQPVDPFTGLANPSGLLAELMNDPDELLARRCETTTGVRVSAEHVLRAALAGHVRRAVVDARNVTVDFGRKQRLFTGPARDAALLLLRSCEHPGCLVAADVCQVDHSTEWADGGSTDQRNGGSRCGSHNRERHRRRWPVRRATNGRNYTLRDDGTVMLPVGCRIPRFPRTSDDEADDSGDDMVAIPMFRTHIDLVTGR